MSHDFGSLTPVLQSTPEGRSILGSAGPISDAFIFGTEPVMLLNGPQGSAKTTSEVKKAIVEAQRIWPWAPGGVRRYVLGVYREKYDNLWSATIPSWWKVLPKDLGTWVGSSPRAAEHTIKFEDRYGPIELVARFKAFGEQADPDDLRGNEFTDAMLDEMDTMPERLVEALGGRVGREPPREILRRPGRIYGSCNAPSVQSWVYKAFWEDQREGYKLYRQPGGLDAGAENLSVVGRAYYEDQARNNAHKPSWVRRFVHNRPGYVQDGLAVYPEYDDDRHRSPTTLNVDSRIPVTIGVDAGLTPAAVFQQELPSGQVLWLAEVAMERAGESAFANAVLAVLASPRFRDCEFNLVFDPACYAGDDLEEGSWATRVAKLLGLKGRPAHTNDPSARQEAVRVKLKDSLDGGRPAFLLDPSCKGLRRGFNETYVFRKQNGTNEITSVQKAFDSHVHDAGQYAALETGSARSRHRQMEALKERQKQRQASRPAGRYNPLANGR